MPKPLDLKTRPRETARLKTIGTRLTTIDTRSAKPPPKAANPFYLTPEWRALVTDLKRERGERCEDCHRTNTRIFCDHVTEIQDGGALLDKGNLRLLCGACHTRKTNAVRAARQAR